MTLTLNQSSRPDPGRPRTRRALGWAAIATAGFGLVIAPASVALAAPPAPLQVTVESSQLYTPTGIEVHKGDAISIGAVGFIHFGPSPIEHVAPPGIHGGACTTVASENGSKPFVAPKLDCWSLIAKIGDSAPFAIGTQRTFHAPISGLLSLGVNDNDLLDNSGTWQATVAVNATPVTQPTTPPVAKKSSKSSAVGLILGVIAALIVIGGIVFLLAGATKRRRASAELAALQHVGGRPEPQLVEVPQPEPDPEPRPEPEPVAEEVPEEGVEVSATAKAAGFALPVGPIQESVAPAEGQTVDVNIFEVKLQHGIDLRVGYNYFPADTSLRWQVRQDSLFAQGHLVTEGGGSMYHYVTLPLSVKLASTVPADVEFTWTIGGVPFRYSVRRDPGC